jgi:hypothetical protein
VTAPITEAQLQAAILDLCKWTGWAVFHDNDSRRNTPGFPDLVLVHRETGRTLFRELKAAGGRLTPDQREWISYLGKHNDAGVWTVHDWTSGVITAALTGRQQATA